MQYFHSYSNTGLLSFFQAHFWSTFLVFKKAESAFHPENFFFFKARFLLFSVIVRESLANVARFIVLEMSTVDHSL